MKIVYPDKWLPCDGIILEEAANTAVRCSDIPCKGIGYFHIL